MRNLWRWKMFSRKMFSIAFIFIKIKFKLPGDLTDKYHEEEVI